MSVTLLPGLIEAGAAAATPFSPNTARVLLLVAAAVFVNVIEVSVFAWSPAERLMWQRPREPTTALRQRT